MKTITLRDVPESLAKSIEQRAKKAGKSLNRTVMEMLEERTLAERQRSHGPFNDLDHLAGTWTEEEAEEFSRALNEQRRVDQVSSAIRRPI